MSWAELFERAAAHGVDEAAIREALAERRAGRGDATGSGEGGDDAPEADGP